MATTSVASQFVRQPPAPSVAESAEEPTEVPAVSLDPAEVDEWLESLDDLLLREGPDAVRQILTQLYSRAKPSGSDCSVDYYALCQHDSA